MMMDRSEFYDLIGYRGYESVDGKDCKKGKETARYQLIVASSNRYMTKNRDARDNSGARRALRRRGHRDEHLEEQSPTARSPTGAIPSRSSSTRPRSRRAHS